MLICSFQNLSGRRLIAVFTLPDLRELHALVTIIGKAQQAFFVSNVGDLKSYWFSVAYIELSSGKPTW
jgi:S-methylmethionine-dependent homocysteine/selenocysteine methylase